MICEFRMFVEKGVEKQQRRVLVDLGDVKAVMEPRERRDGTLGPCTLLLNGDQIPVEGEYMPFIRDRFSPTRGSTIFTWTEQLIDEWLAKYASVLA